MYFYLYLYSERIKKDLNNDFLKGKTQDNRNKVFFQKKRSFRVKNMNNDGTFSSPLIFYLEKVISAIYLTNGKVELYFSSFPLKISFLINSIYRKTS